MEGEAFGGDRHSGPTLHWSSPKKPGGTRGKRVGIATKGVLILPILSLQGEGVVIFLELWVPLSLHLKKNGILLYDKDVDHYKSCW